MLFERVEKLCSFAAIGLLETKRDSGYWIDDGSRCGTFRYCMTPFFMSAANASVTNPAVSTMPVAPITIVVMAAGGLSLLLAIGLLVQHLVNRMPSKDIESPKVISEPEGHVLRYREQLLRLKPLDLPEEEIVFHLPPAPFSPPPFHHNNPALALPMKAVARLSFRDSVYLNMISNPSMSSLSDDDASSSVIHFEESRSHFIVY